MFADLRAAFRSALRSPGVPLFLSLTLSLGVGANVVVWTFVRSLLLSPLPFEDADRLVRITTSIGGSAGQISALEVEDLARRSRTLDEIAPHRATQWAVSEGNPESIAGTVTTWNLFRLLGVKPFLGATWPAEHDKARVFAIVLSHGLWERRYGADPSIVGRTIQLDGAPYQVLAVMARGFQFPGRADLWRRSPAADYESRSIRSYAAVGKLRPDVTLAQARAELAGIAKQLETEFRETNRGVTFRVDPLRSLWVGDAGPYLGALSAAVVLVLSIACLNAFSLLLAHAMENDGETAVRLALGAPPRALVRRLVADGIVITGPASFLSALFAWGGIRIFKPLLTHETPPWIEVTLDLPMLALLVLTVSAVCIGTSLFPARRALRTDLRTTLGPPTARVSTRTRPATRLLLAGQFALSILLLSGAGLMVRAMIRLHEVPLGFDPENLVTAKVDPPWSRYGSVEQTAPAYRRMMEELRAIPGVLAAGATDALPLTSLTEQEGQGQMTVTLFGQSPDVAALNPYVRAQIVSTGYFATMGIPLNEGRVFNERDRLETEPVAVVSADLARRLWPEASALGQRLQLGARGSNYRPVDGPALESPWATVIGIVGTVRGDVFSGPGLDYYLSDQQTFAPETHIVIRTGGPMMDVARSIRAAVERVDPEQPVSDIRTMEERLSDRTWQQRLSALMFVILAALALLLASSGISGLVARTLRARNREIAIRLALGSSRRALLLMIAKEMGPTLAAGGMVGAVLSLTLPALLRDAIFGAQTSDIALAPLAFVVLALVAAASIAPSIRRAARLDLARVLRGD